VKTSSLSTLTTIWLFYQPLMMDDEECVAASGVIGRGNRCTRRKPASVPRCPPQIIHDLTGAPTRTAALGSQRLLAWALARSALPTIRNRALCGILRQQFLPLFTYFPLTTPRSTQRSWLKAKVCTEFSMKPYISVPLWLAFACFEPPVICHAHEACPLKVTGLSYMATKEVEGIIKARYELC
jgi:hypothetical protein